MKTIDLNQSVYKICKTYPEIKEILIGLGFTDITKPGMLQTAGRFMTIPKGAKLKKIELATIEDRLKDEGFEIL